MNFRQRTVVSLASTALLAVVLTACASDSWAEPHATPTALGNLSAGFVPAVAPTPEATIHPVADSWRRVRPAPGYRVVLLTHGNDKPTKTLVTAIRTWADDEKVDLRAITVTRDPVESIVKAIGMKPDLIVSAGNGLVDPLATVSASHLAQQFLIVGAEIPEPTSNVTAVDWSGASFRGEGLGTSSTYDAASFTAVRCAAAVRAGVAAVLHDLTGIVIWID